MENLYIVKSDSGREFHVWATSGNQAKRAYCKAHNIKPDDWFCGIPSLHARKLKPAEVKAWESKARAIRDTYIYVHGMMGIFVQNYAERKGILNDRS